MKKMEEFERSVTACAVFVSVDVLASKQNGRDSLVIYVIGHLQSCDVRMPCSAHSSVIIYKISSEVLESRGLGRRLSANCLYGKLLTSIVNLAPVCIDSSVYMVTLRQLK